MKELIFQYWDYCAGKSNGFDFYELFEELLYIIEKKLALHGQLDFEKYLNYVDELYSNLDCLRKFAYKSEHTNFESTYEDILSGVFKPRYSHLRQYFLYNENYHNLLKVYGELLIHNCSADKFSNIIFVDKIIHLSHNSGLLFPIEEWRIEYDRET